MKFLVALFAAVATASASGLLGAAPLIPKVQVAPAQVSVVKQPITIQQTYGVPRSVPYPVKAVSYTAPVVASPVVHAAPAYAYAAGVPAYSAYAAGVPAYSAYAAGVPAYSSYAAGVPAYSSYAAGLPLAHSYAAPGLLASPAVTLAH